LLKRNGENKVKVVIGRDARLSGQMVNNIVCGTLVGLGINVIDLGLSPQRQLLKWLLPN
jgi:phosphomannomutase